MWKHFVLTEPIHVPKCLWRFLQVLIFHCFTGSMKVPDIFKSNWSKPVEITFCQKKLLWLVPEILNKIDAGSQGSKGTAEVVWVLCGVFFFSFQYKKMLLKQLFLSADYWRLFNQAHVLQKLNNLAGFNIDVSEKYFHHLLSNTIK